MKIEMNSIFSAYSVASVLPLSRTKVLEDVIMSQRFGAVDQAYLSRGHIFVVLEGRRKLVTFDTKSADLVQDVENEGCLDIETQTPIVGVIGMLSNAVYIVQQNGILQHWQYKADSSWRFATELSLVSQQMSEVTDVCLNVAQNTVYWCERWGTSSGRQIYCICKRQLSDEGDKSKFRSGSTSEVLIRNCPKSRVYPMGHGVLLLPEAKPEAVTIVLLLCTLTGKIEVVAGEDRIVSDHTTHTEVDFKHIVMSCLNLINKVRSVPVKFSRYFPSKQTLIQLLSDGQIHQIVSEKAMNPSHVQLENFQPSGILDCNEILGNLGIVYSEEIRIYSLSTGKCLGVVSSPEGSQIIGSCQSLLGYHLSGFFTNSNLYVIQRSRKVNSKDERQLLEGCKFQSDGVRLAFIDKLKTSATKADSASTLDILRENWLHMTGKLPNSRLVETVEPFLKEYWSLECLLQKSLDKPEHIPQLQQLSARDMVDHLLNPASPMSRSSRQAQLLLLSHSHPGDVLDGVLSNLDLGSDELSTSQQQKWQCILTAENSDVAMNCDIAVPLFEQICHLLFKQRPDALMTFLRRGQLVCDQKVGVSAFVRRRQTLQVYERALRCIPEPLYSVDQEAAIFVTVHLLLTSEVEDNILKAVQLLLRYEKWQEAIDLLQQQSETSFKTYNILYQIILTALTENKVLPQYSNQIFTLMPALSSCEQFSSAVSGQIEEKVFCSGSDSVSIEQIRPHLLKHMVDDR